MLGKTMKSFFSFFRTQVLYVSLLLLAVLSLFVGLMLFLLGYGEHSSLLFKYILAIGSIPFWYSLLRDIARGDFGVDIIAGVALVGTFFIGQYLAGVVVLLMLSGGQLLEVYAMSRARRELSLLLSKTPKFAHVRNGEEINEILLSEITLGMKVIVKAGEVISVDGTIIEGLTTIDESALTGESATVKKTVGNMVYAGTENRDAVIVIEVEKLASDTKYQSIVKLVQDAEKSKAPIVRMADKYSLYFTGITAVIAFVSWIISHDLVRVVSVLVVATPCPLLLAVPIAIMSGMSKASSRGIIIKDGSALERLSEVKVFFFDKTGTLTLGTPEVAKVLSFSGLDEKQIVASASTLDNLSVHILSESLIKYAYSKNITLTMPTHFKEYIGDGVSGEIDGVEYVFGKAGLVNRLLSVPLEKMTEIERSSKEEGTIAVFLAKKNVLLGAIFFQDVVREDAGELFKKLKQEGVEQTIIITGDTKERGEAVASALQVTRVISACLPNDKQKHVEELRKSGIKVAMVGDGVNDAPALASADVGIALGTHGETVTSDVADIVIVSPLIGRTYDAFLIAKKTILLAKQSIFIGIGASIIAMIFSALGYIPPLTGVILQEGIDVIVIMNALRLGSMITFHDK